GIGNGPGSGQVILSGLASLRGSLQRSTPVNLFQVQVAPGTAPFYVRQIVADDYTSDQGWQPSGNKFTKPSDIPLGAGNYPYDPEPANFTPDQHRVFAYSAQFQVLALGGHELPILSNPGRIANVQPGSWNAHTGSVLDASLKRGMSYSEDVQQLAPTVSQMQTAPAWVPDDPKLKAQYLQLPGDLPAQVTQLAA